jgi:hypothetical protein
VNVASKLQARCLHGGGFQVHALSFMETANERRALVGMLEALSDYRKFAEECDRLAQMAETERHRKTLERMAEAWRTLAEEESSHR